MPQPKSVVFPNIFSGKEHVDFARQQIDQNVRRGALILWPWNDVKPFMVLPMSLAVSCAGKLTLIVDGRLPKHF